MLTFKTVHRLHFSPSRLHKLFKDIPPLGVKVQQRKEPNLISVTDYRLCHQGFKQGGLCLAPLTAQFRVMIRAVWTISTFPTIQEVWDASNKSNNAKAEKLNWNFFGLIDDVTLSYKYV